MTNTIRKTEKVLNIKKDNLEKKENFYIHSQTR